MLSGMSRPPSLHVFTFLNIPGDRPNETAGRSWEFFETERTYIFENDFNQVEIPPCIFRCGCVEDKFLLPLAQEWATYSVKSPPTPGQEGWLGF